MLFRCKLGAQILSSGLAVYLGFLAFEPSEAIQVIKHSGYWLLLLASLLAILACWRVYRELDAGVLSLGWLKAQRAPLLMIGCLSVLFYVLQENDYKVVMDEPLLAATALHMHHEKEAMTVTRAYNIGGTFNILGGYVGKRPYFYPFLVSVMHDLTGYRAYQGIILNHLLTPIFLGLLYMIGHRIGHRPGGYCALALSSTVPLFAICVNGGGFDLLNAVMLLATLWAGMLYLQRQSDARFDLLILSAVLLAQTRYESSLYIGGVIIIILISWYRDRRIRLTWTSVAVPLLLVCLPLQQIIFEQYPGLWQLESEAATPFALALIPQNLANALNFFFTLFPLQPGSLLLSALFCVALVCALILGLGGRLKRAFAMADMPDTPALLSFFIPAIVSFLLMMAYHWGQADDIVASRIIIPFIILQILFIVAIIHALPFSNKIYFACIAAAAIYFMAAVRPETARTDYLVRLVDQRDVTWTVERVRERSGNGTLFISDKHLAILAEQESCLPQILAAKAKPQIDLHLKLGTFPEIIVFYKLIEPVEGKGAWKPETPIEKDFDIEVLEETKLSETLYVRMGRIRGVNFREGDSPPYGEKMLSGLSEPGTNMEIFATTLP